MGICWDKRFHSMGSRRNTVAAFQEGDPTNFNKCTEATHALVSMPITLKMTNSNRHKYQGSHDWAPKLWTKAPTFTTKNHAPNYSHVITTQSSFWLSLLLNVSWLFCFWDDIQREPLKQWTKKEARVRRWYTWEHSLLPSCQTWKQRPHCDHSWFFIFILYKHKTPSSVIQTSSFCYDEETYS